MDSLRTNLIKASSQLVQSINQSAGGNIKYLIAFLFLFSFFIIWSLAIIYTGSFLTTIHKTKYAISLSIIIWINPALFYQFLTIFNCDSLSNFYHLLITPNSSIAYVDYSVIFMKSLSLWNSCILCCFCTSQIVNQYKGRFYCTKNWIFKFLLVLLDPLNINFIILQNVHRNFVCATNEINDKNIQQVESKNDKFFIIKLVILLVTIGIIWLISPNTYYQSLLFPKIFQPQKNIIWILYGHMFNRYLIYYQATLLFMAVLVSIPLGLLKIGYHCKVFILFVINAYISYMCGNIKILMILVLGTCLNRTYQSLLKHRSFFQAQKNTQMTDQQTNKGLQCIDIMLKVIKTLSTVGYVGGIFFFFVYCRLLTLYLSSFMVNIGHVFLFGCIPWILIVIVLVEILQVQLKISKGMAILEQQKPSWKQYFIRFLKKKGQVNHLNSQKQQA